MSIDYHVYCGPAYRCTFHTEVSKRKIFCCSQESCILRGTEVRHDTNFCYKCGSKVDLTDIEITILSVNHSEVGFEINERMRYVVIPKTMTVYWISNFIKIGVPEVFDPRVMYGDVIQSQESIDRHTVLFTDLFDDNECETLMKHYDKVELITNVLLVWQD